MYSVLYVDDEPALLEIAKLILEQQGEFTLTTITSAIEALTMMQETGFDAVVADYQMPGMDGIIFLKKTRAIFGDLPFILFTGKGREEVVIEAINNGADSYIQKGGDPRSQFAELAHKIKNAIERKRIGDALKQDEIRFETLVTIYQMTPAPLREVMTFAIEKAVELTTSSIGYLACVNDDETMMTIQAWSTEVMKGCDIPLKPLEYPVDSTGLWGEAIRQRRPVITNDYTAPSPLKRGNPPGHPLISRHMNVPIFDGTHIVMVAGVGNKKTEYDDRDVRELSLLMHGLWNVIKWRRAERALRRGEEQYRMLAENSLDVIYHMSLPEGQYDYVSPASLVLFGYSPEEFYHNPLLGKSIIHPAWQDYFQQMWTRLQAGDVPPSYEFQIVHKNGDIRWMNQRNTPIRDKEGRLIALEGVVTDVTGSRQAEEALRRSESRYRGLYESMQDAYVVVDMTGRLTEYNSAYREMLGYSDEELSALIYKDVTPEKWHVYEQKIIDEQVLPRGYSDTYQKECRKKDGTVFPIEVRTFLIRNQTGQPSGMWALMRDITERKQAEELLQLNEARLRKAQEIGRTGSWEFDPASGKIWGTKEAFRIFGLHPLTDELPIDLIEACISERQRVHQALVDLLADGTPYDLEYAINPADGAPQRIITSIADTVRDEAGRTQKVIGVIRDITEQKRVEDALRKSEERYRTLADNLPDYLVVLQNNTIRYANQATAEATGVARQDLIGRHFLDFIAPESRPQILENVQRRAQGGSLPTYEAVLLAKDGEKKRVIIKVTEILFMGEPASLTMITDITEQKRAEERLRQANRQITLLSGITRHDILNMVTIILGYLGIAEMISPDPTLNEYFKRMESATRTIQSQIEFTRIYQDLGTHEPQWQSPDTILHRLHPPPGVTLITDLQDVVVYADPMFERVFFNLLDNSIRHGQRVTEIRVSAERVGEDLALVWEDNGAGIPTEVKERIFDRGFGENTGLGLFLVREILSISGITIRETGVPESGARFMIMIPKGTYRTLPEIPRAAPNPPPRR